MRAPNQGGHEEPEDYEKGLITALRDRIHSGDHITVIGGGLGVTAVIAAQLVGENGHVTVYEGAKTMIEHINDTLRLNDVADRVDVHHAVVAEEVSLEGDVGEAEIISPQELPACDIPEMDCEGAETAILSDLEPHYREIIVETHGNLGEVMMFLRESGYSVISEEIAETGQYKEMCKEMI